MIDPEILNNPTLPERWRPFVQAAIDYQLPVVPFLGDDPSSFSDALHIAVLSGRNGPPLQTSTLLMVLRQHAPWLSSDRMSFVAEVLNGSARERELREGTLLELPCVDQIADGNLNDIDPTLADAVNALPETSRQAVVECIAEVVTERVTQLRNDTREAAVRVVDTVSRLDDPTADLPSVQAEVDRTFRTWPLGQRAEGPVMTHLSLATRVVAERTAPSRLETDPSGRLGDVEHTAPSEPRINAPEAGPEPIPRMSTPTTPVSPPSAPPTMPATPRTPSTPRPSPPVAPPEAAGARARPAGLPPRSTEPPDRTTRQRPTTMVRPQGQTESPDLVMPSPPAREDTLIPDTLRQRPSVLDPTRRADGDGPGRLSI